MEKQVLQKYIASSGYCSRRKAEELIRAGKVEVNGSVAELGQKVSVDDKVSVDGKSIQPASEKIYIKMNKPVGYTCTTRNFEGEKNVFQLLNEAEKDKRPSPFPRGRLGGGSVSGLHIVGRLDKNSRGLLILTNDGDFTEKMTHPRYEHEKEYLVVISDFRLQISDFFVRDLISKFKKGVDIGDGDGVVKAKECEYLGESRFRIVLTEGKKRQIRRMFAVFDLEVEDLLRVRIGEIELGDLEEGEWEVLNLKFEI